MKITDPFQHPDLDVKPYTETPAGGQTFTIGYKFNRTVSNPDDASPEEAQTSAQSNDTKIEPVQYNDFEQSLIDQHKELFPKIAGMLIRKMGAKPQDAEDAAQEAFLAAWRRRSELEKGGDTTKPGVAPRWLFTAAHNTILKKWDKDKRCVATTLEDMPAVFESDGADYRATLELVTQVIGSLSIRKREIAARLLLGVTNEEISKELGITVPLVQRHKTLLRRSVEEKLRLQGLDVSHYRRRTGSTAVDDGLAEGL